MKKIIILGVLIFTPAVTFAISTVQSIVLDIGNIISLATPIIVALALLFFFIGLAKYILNTGDDEKKAEGRNIMIWGIIVLFVMVSVWGLVEVVGNTFKIGGGGSVVPPRVTY